ncbi:MAG: PstS family phosphate ABC transporter substrate-binding protein [Fuerstiella sp.]
MMNFRLCFALMLGSLIGCSVESANNGGDVGENAVGSAKRIVADGSSTVGPITGLVGEMFEELHSDVEVPVTITGTGTGFGRFAAGEIDINDASRRIKDSEKAKCEEGNIEYVELMVAMDGISVVVNKDNDFIDSITVAQLKKMWEPDSTVKKWKDIDPTWPDEDIKLFGPGRESGTFDYFTKAINGEEGATRDDYSSSGDDNQLVTGVSGDKYALGYFGYGYYEMSKDKLKMLKVSSTDDPAAGVAPSPEVIQSGAYAPLARPVFIYVNKASLKRPEVAEFLTFYLGEGQEAIPKVGCVKMSAKDLEAANAALAEALK